jgi:hypothetical protein
MKSDDGGTLAWLMIRFACQKDTDRMLAQIVELY